MKKQFALVYQCGIANVFRIDMPETSEQAQSPKYVRVVQGAYSQAEQYCRGAIGAGADVLVYHSDVAGDVLLCPRGPWSEGAGDLWADKKHPPIAA